MKKRLLSLAFTALILTLSLTSCLVVPTPDENGKLPEGQIWSADSTLSVVYGENTMSEHAQSIYNALSGLRNGNTYVENGTSAPDAHEIVIGKCDRPVSVKAYAELDKISLGEDEHAYLIYSDGSSVCIAYDDNRETFASEAAIKYFTDYYLKDSLTLNAGVVHSAKLNFKEIRAELDETYIEEKWAALEEFLADKNGENIVPALRELFSLYDPEMVGWLAELYDPSIGGFYYSKSGLRTEGYLPDAESTAQALRILSDTKMFYQFYGKDYSKALPEKMGEQIVNFVYNLQDANGYFYHPQWSKELVNQKTSRRARDLGHCVGILQKFGVEPKYTPANQTATEDAAYLLPLTSPLGSSTVNAVSKVIAVEEASGEAYSPFLESLDTFKIWLSQQKIATNSYGIGNNLTAIYSEIKNRDVALGTFDPLDAENSLIGYLVNWLNVNQNPENGLWHAESNYYGVNGLMKISGVYSKSGVPMPNSDKAVQAAIDAMTTAEESTGITCIYNTWYAVNRVLNIMTNYGTEEDKAQIDALRAKVYEAAPEALRATREKLAVYVKEQGSFSYNPETTIANSQGCPVAIAGSVEGDVNATCMGTTDTLNYIWGCLQVPTSAQVPMFGYGLWLDFLDAVENSSPVIKETADFTETVANFDDDDIGMEPVGAATASVNATSLTYGASITVVEDMRQGATGNVVKLDSKYGKDKITLSLADPRSTSCFVFETEMCVESTTTKVGGHVVQLFIGDCYYLSLINQGDHLSLIDFSSGTSSLSKNNTLGATPAFGEWFKLRVEYYVGDDTSVRIKVYYNDTLISVSDNYYDALGNKFSGLGIPCTTYTNTRVYIPSKIETLLYIDNMMTCKTNDLYEKVTDTSLEVNVDASYGNEYESDGGEYYNDNDYKGTRYDFSYVLGLDELYNRVYTEPKTDEEGNVTVEGFSTDRKPSFTTISDGMLICKNSANWQGMTLATEEAYQGSNGDIYVFEADFTWLGGQMSTGHSSGAAFVGLLGDHRSSDNGNMFCYNHIKFTEGVSDTMTFFGATLEKGVTYNLRLEYEVGTGTLTFYVDGEEVSTTYSVGTTNGSDAEFHGFGIYMRKNFSEALEFIIDNVYMGIIEN